METGFMNRIIGLVIALAVGGLLVGGLLIPSIDGMTEPEKTIQNVGMPYAAAGGDHIITVTSGGMTFDNESVDMSLFPGNFDTYTIVYGAESFIRWGIANVVIVSDSDGLHQFPISTNTITVTISGNTAVITTSASATTYTINDVVYYMSPAAGDYVLSLNPYVNDESIVYAAGDTVYPKADRPASVRIWNIWTALNGDVTVRSCGTNTAGFTATVANTTVDLENISSNLYRYNSVNFEYTATYTNDQEETTDYTLPATYTYFLAPKEIVYDNPAYIGSTNAVIMGVVSLLGIVALVVVAANGIKNKY